MMSPQQRDELKTTINSRMAELEQEIEMLNARATPVAPDNAIGRLTRMDEIVNQGVNQTALTQAHAQIEKLKIALSRSDSDNFGVCESCLKPIPIPRLLAMPQASLCVACQQHEEQS